MERLLGLIEALGFRFVRFDTGAPASAREVMEAVRRELHAPRCAHCGLEPKGQLHSVVLGVCAACRVALTAGGI